MKKISITDAYGLSIIAQAEDRFHAFNLIKGKLSKTGLRMARKIIKK